MKICLQDKTKPEQQETSYGAVLQLPDLAPLKARYGKRALSRNIFKCFQKEWEGPTGAQLREPSARLTLLQACDLEEKSGISLQTEAAALVVAAIWTLGPALENHSSKLLDKNREIEGILYNVAGSLTLVGMHARLREWLHEKVASQRGLNIVEEFYPGGPGLGMETLSSLLDLADPERTLGVTCLGGELLHPLKSGCALFLLGEGEEHFLSPMEPCNPCLKRKCLYFQMGGCHIV